jgi:hypothetical protein
MLTENQNSNRPMSAPYVAPPVTRSKDHRERRVGLEVELAGLSVEELAKTVATVLGGSLDAAGAEDTSASVETEFGTFRIELDSASLQSRAYLRPLEGLGITSENVLEGIEQSVLAVASEFVPLELVAPPIEWSRLHELDPLWAEMRSQGGLGTRAAFRYAFGLHLNPELPDPMDAGCILAHMQAFFLLEDWLLREEGVDWTRRVVPFIDPFPEEYRRLCLQPEYAPSVDDFIEDYLRFSPTRNRVFDLLPLFKQLRPSVLEGRDIDGAELVNARPTFHHRMPNSDIDTPDWTPALAWANWVEVERLAVDDDRRAQMATSYSDLNDLPFRFQRHNWLEAVDTTWMATRA